MTLKKFQILFTSILSSQEEIIHVLESNNSLLVSCKDGSGFFINIFESKGAFIHDENDAEFIRQYMDTHSQEEFAQDILNMVTGHPGFLFYFSVFSKLEEMKIIDSGLFYHIIDNIIYHEAEFDKFLAKVLSHYGVKDNDLE